MIPTKYRKDRNVKITLGLLKDSLGDGVLSLASNDENRGWFQVLEQRGEKLPSEEYLLFCEASNLPAATCDRGLVLIGVPSEDILQNNDVLYFLHETDQEKLFLEIQNVFLKYNRWEASLQEASYEKQGLEKLFLLSSEIFGNSMFFHDEHFHLLCHTEIKAIPHAWEYDQESDHYVLPLEVLNDFKINKDYLATLHVRGPAIFPEDTFGYRILYQNIWENGKYRGRIGINEMDRDLRSSDAYLLQYFCSFVLNVMLTEDYALHSKTPSLAVKLTKLIEGKPIDSKKFDEILLQYGWSVHDEYYCVCMFMENQDMAADSIFYLVERFRREIYGACIFAYANTIVFLINMTVEELSVFDFRNKYGIIMRESLLKTGFSSVISDPNNFYYMYKQAIYAVETGKKRHETFWSYCFDDYWMTYVLQNALSEFPANFLCSKEIFLLEAYDHEHATELVRTMRVFLENDRKLTETSEQLKIHRSTLLYRIERIENLTKLDLKNAKIRFRIMLSYYLLDEERGHI